jgi:hypothetical protein
MGYNAQVTRIIINKRIASIASQHNGVQGWRCHIK